MGQEEQDEEEEEETDKEHQVQRDCSSKCKTRDPAVNGVEPELWEECEDLRTQLLSALQAKDKFQWEARDAQRRLQASENSRQQLQVQVKKRAADAADAAPCVEVSEMQ